MPRFHPYSMNEVIGRAWAPSTLKRYNAAARHFNDWCDSNFVPDFARLPASEDLLCAYAMTFVGHLSGGAISARLNGVRSWHIRSGHTFLGGSRLSYLVRGADNLRPSDSVRSPRLPLTTEMITFLLQKLDFNSSLHVCVYACITTAFWGQLRMGELLPPKLTDFDPSVLPRWRDFGLPNADGSRTLFLPHTKTRQRSGENVMISKQDDDFDPITSIHYHSLMSSPSPDDLIASYLDEFGVRKALTLKTLLDVVNPIFVAGGFHPISGHCPRIGGTTAFLISGVPPDIVKMTGRWASDAFYRYWRSLEVIAPRYLEHCTQRYDHERDGADARYRYPNHRSLHYGRL